MIIYDPIITGSFQINGSTISSVESIDAVSQSVADLKSDSGSFSTRVSLVETSANSLNSASSSYLLNTSDTLVGDLTVTGTITAQEFHTEFVSASIIYQSGSTQFGNSSDDIHDFQGTVKISGSITYGGTGLNILGQSSDGADNQAFFIGAGGAGSDTRGAYIWGRGNEATNGGKIQINAGNVSTGNIELYTGGSVRMFVSSSGNVGIGTASPATILDVNGGTGENTAKFQISGNDAIIKLGSNGGGGPHGFQFDYESATFSDGMSMYYRTGTEQITFENSTGTSGSKLMVIGRNGNVGIGTDTPAAGYKLDVNGPIQGLGISSNSVSKSYTWRLNNTGNSGNIWRRICRFDGGHSARIKIEMTGQTGYGSNTAFGSVVTIIGQINNGSNLQGSWWIEGYEAAVLAVQFELIAANQYYINVQVGSYSEYAITATISYGTLTLSDTTVSGSSNVARRRWFRSETSFLDYNVGIGTTSPGYKLHVASDSSGYSAGFDNSIIIGEGNSTPRNLRFANLTGAYNTFQEGSRIFQYFPDGNGTAEASIYFNRDEGTGGGVTSGTCLTFHTTKNTYGPYGAETNYERMRITGRGRVLIGTTNENPAENNVAGVSFFEDGRMFISSDNNEVIRINRKTSDGVLIYFHQDGVAEGNISVSGNTVSYNGFAGCHESSGIDTSVEIGTVVSTIDELDTRIVNQTSQEIKDHAKVKVSDIVGDNRVYGVVQRYNEEGKPMIASVGIGSVLVVGSCSGGDLLESNGDGTARVQNDDIIRSKTIGKVTVGDSRTEVKLVSIVLYCG